MHNESTVGTAVTPPSALRASLEIRVAFGRLRRRLRNVATGDELSSSQASVLARLRKGEAATASALATLEGVRPQSMAATIASLQQLGLVAREPDPSDGRQQIVTVTTAGRATDEDNQRARGEWLAAVLATHCTEDERRTVIDAAAILERVARA